MKKGIEKVAWADFFIKMMLFLLNHSTRLEEINLIFFPGGAIYMYNPVNINLNFCTTVDGELFGTHSMRATKHI